MFGRCLVVVNPKLLGGLLSFLEWDLPVLRQVNFVPHENPRNSVFGVLVNRVDPSRDTIERILICNVVGDNDSIGLLVEGVGESLESLLASSVPNLNINVSSVLGGVLLCGVVESKCCYMLIDELFLHILLDHRCLPDGAISKNDYLYL